VLLRATDGNAEEATVVVLARDVAVADVERADSLLMLRSLVVADRTVVAGPADDVLAEARAASVELRAPAGDRAGTVVEALASDLTEVDELAIPVGPALVQDASTNRKQSRGTRPSEGREDPPMVAALAAQPVRPRLGSRFMPHSARNIGTVSGSRLVASRTAGGESKRER
jgi:hypothetical protein